MSKHTPGPWYYWDNDGLLGVGKSHSDEADILNAVSQSTRQRSEDIANMLLIAAAPDLLEALEEIANELAAVLYSEWSCKESDCQEIVKARVAIAKARGEA